MATMQKITSNLWFNQNAEEAVKHYTSIFKKSKIGRVTHYGKAGYEQHGMQPGTIMTIEFWLEEQPFLALNGGPLFTFSEAVSFVVNCDSQHEIDYYWSKLGEGGDEQAQVCGWLKDKFGLSWQIVPVELADMLQEGGSEKAERTMTAMMQMKKLDIDQLKKAYHGQLGEKTGAS